MARGVVVTGGAGGLGAAVTQGFLEDGWHVVVPWLFEQELDRVQEHERLTLVQADLMDPDAAGAVVAAAGPDLRPLGNLVGGFAMGGRVHRRRSRSSSSSCASTCARRTSCPRPRC